MCCLNYASHQGCVSDGTGASIAGHVSPAGRGQKESARSDEGRAARAEDERKTCGEGIFNIKITGREVCGSNFFPAEIFLFEIARSSLRSFVRFVMRFEYVNYSGIF